MEYLKGLSAIRLVVLLGGRITLIQVCVPSIHLYNLSLLRIPLGVTESLERIMWKFLLFGHGRSERSFDEVGSVVSF